MIDGNTDASDKINTPNNSTVSSLPPEKKSESAGIITPPDFESGPVSPVLLFFCMSLRDNPELKLDNGISLSIVAKLVSIFNLKTSHKKTLLVFASGQRFIPFLPPPPPPFQPLPSAPSVIVITSCGQCCGQEGPKLNKFQITLVS